jgi:8-oxo-(d)GTP phosphatase
VGTQLYTSDTEAPGPPPPTTRPSNGDVHNLGVVELLLVRHAHAGSKDLWEADDRLRPVSRRGRSDALALARILAPKRPRRVVSSPLLRCLQTVEPLASSLGLTIEESDLLLPDAGAGAASLVRDLGSCPGRIVVCTHGETIDELQLAFAATRNNGRKPGFAPGAPHEKGSVWVLRFRDGWLAGARYLPPAALARS